MRIEKMLYGKAVVVDEQLADFLRNSDGANDLRLVKAKKGKPFTNYSYNYRPLDVSFPIIALREMGLLARKGRPYLHQNLETIRSELGTLHSSLLLRSRELLQTNLTIHQKLVEQRSYWDAYNGFSQLKDEFSYEKIKELDEVLQVLKSLVTTLGLSQRELNVLSGYQDTNAELARIYNEIAGKAHDYEIIDVSNKRALSVHGSANYGLATYYSYAVLPRNESEKVASLKNWWMYNQVRQDFMDKVASKEEYSSYLKYQKPPKGTMLVLARKMVCLDVNLQPVTLPIIERVAIRLYEGNKAKYEKYALFDLNVRKFLNEGKIAYLPINNRKLIWSGILSGVPSFIDDLAVLTTTRNNCASCHNFAFPGPGDLLSLSNSNSSTQPDITPHSQEEYTEKYIKMSQHYERLISEQRM